MTSKFREALDDLDNVGSKECWADWAIKWQYEISQALLIADRLESGEVSQKMIDAAARYRLSECRSEQGRADANGTFKAMAKVMIEEVQGE